MSLNMEYVYAALLLHKLKREVSEDNIKNVVKAAGVDPDEVRVKALVAALGGIDIGEALKAAAPVVAAPAGTSAPQPQPEASKAEVKKEEEGKKEEEALAGLSSLFG